MHVKHFELKELQKDEKERYEVFFKMADNPSLTQDWEYGNIISKIKGWKCKRYEIVLNEETIAVYQAYERNIRYLPFFKIIYLNRGPVLKKNYSKADIQSVYQSLRKKYILWKGYFLVINPLLVVGDENHLVLKKSGFIKLNKRFYLTAYINLLADESALRAQLKAKWRNQLVGAERKNIHVKIDESGEFDLFLKGKYLEMVTQKKINGLSECFIDNLFTEYRKLGKLIFFYAFTNENEPIACIATVTYGSHAIYLIGWVDDNYRNLNPSNLLIWNAILHLKQRNIKVFDLGGMDPELSGINKFKLGTGAVENKYYSSCILLK
jgi:lipid II:glycine glycyltransferase (peptidoglycan interpeptide bridge formation enzyme)